MKERGVTLIELLIVIVVVGILTAIAVPSYQAYMQRGYRAEAKTILMEDATILERNFTLANKYTLDSGGNSTTNLITAQSPKSGTAIYNITLVAADSSANASANFTLTATPVAGGPMASDTCGALTLSNTGVQGVTGTASVSSCWSK